MADLEDDLPAIPDDAVDDDDPDCAGSQTPVSGLQTSAPEHAVAQAPQGLAPARQPRMDSPPGVVSISHRPLGQPTASHAGTQKFPLASCAHCPVPHSAAVMHVWHPPPPDDETAAELPPPLEVVFSPPVPAGGTVGQPARIATANHTTRTSRDMPQA